MVDPGDDDLMGPVLALDPVLEFPGPVPTVRSDLESDDDRDLDRYRIGAERGRGEEKDAEKGKKRAHGGRNQLSGGGVGVGVVRTALADPEPSLGVSCFAASSMRAAAAFTAAATTGM